jgi:hypothetical protein
VGAERALPCRGALTARRPGGTSVGPANRGPIGKQDGREQTRTMIATSIYDTVRVI